MKKSVTLIASAALAFAAHAGNNYITTARVVDSSPIIETVYEPYESCRYEYRRQQRDAGANTENKLLGGIVGGVAGSAVGKGSGRDAAAGIGAILGGEVADGDGITEGELIGGLAGGIIGNQVGKGKGKTAATAAGALIGSIVGDNLQNGDVASAAPASKKVRVCETAEKAKKVITGYEVTLEYGGFRFTEVVARKPSSDYLDVNVNVEVLEDLTGHNIR